MKLVYLPWAGLLLAGIVYLLVSGSAAEVAIGAVMAFCGLAGWVAAVKRTREEPKDSRRERP